MSDSFVKVPGTGSSKVDSVTVATAAGTVDRERVATIPDRGTAVATAVSVTTGATLLIAANATRKSVTIINNDPSATLYLGPTSGVTTATGIPVPPNGGSAEDLLTTGTWYGIVAAGTLDARVVEVS